MATFSSNTTIKIINHISVTAGAGVLVSYTVPSGRYFQGQLIYVGGLFNFTVNGVDLTTSGLYTSNSNTSIFTFAPLNLTLGEANVISFRPRTAGGGAPDGGAVLCGVEFINTP